MDVVVVGAGGAGLMCAMTAAKRGKKVALLEHNDRIGKKILISGGGRCNFTNIHTTPENYLSENPNFCKSALANYSPWDFIDLVEEYKITYHEKKLGQQFCDKSSRQIVEMLSTECISNGVDIFLQCEILSIKKTEVFKVLSSKGVFEAHSLVVATGGLSFKNLGATSFGYDLAKQFELKVLPTRPALVPLVLGEKPMKHFKELSGVSFEATVRCGKKAAFRENVLMTHRGLSGPAILQISSYWKEGQQLSMDLLSDGSSTLFIEQQSDHDMDVHKLVANKLCKRLAKAWCDMHGFQGKLNRMPIERKNRFFELLQDWQMVPVETEGYKKAEVTRGGLDTYELSSKTMECKKISGLYFIGEVVDVTGWLGGYNFQWAWSSGYAAGNAV